MKKHNPTQNIRRSLALSVNERKTETLILADAMDVLAREIQSGDGIANAAIAEAAERLRSLEVEKCKTIVKLRDAERRIEENHERAERIIQSREAKLERVSMALRDAISTYDPQRDATFVGAERQEAWADALAHGSALGALDVCCGSRMFWFDRKDPRAVFVDKRQETHRLTDSSSKGGSRSLIVDPDLKACFTKLPFADESFSMVAFDRADRTNRQMRGPGNGSCTATINIWCDRMVDAAGIEPATPSV